MANILVNTLIDENNGVNVGDISLRDAIAAANPGDLITFDISIANGTITLNNGELVIDKDLTLEGDTDGEVETRNITVDANGNSRVFRVDDGNNIVDQLVEISGLTITGGQDVDGGGIYNTEDLTLHYSTITGNTATAGKSYAEYFGLYESNASGGGIYTSGTLRLDESIVSENTSELTGGGIDTKNGTVTLTNSVISNNRSSYGNAWFGTGSGGGIYADNSILNITNSTISTNAAGWSGGGLHIQNSSLNLTNSTVNDNRGIGGGRGGSSGGGIFNRESTASITNSTISGNFAGGAAGSGGGIVNSRSNTRIVNSTISNNGVSVRFAPGSGGGILNGNSSGIPFTPSIVIVESTIIANNQSSSDDDVKGDFIDGGHNLIENISGSTGFANPTTITGLDPLLEPLADNGGPTLTHALNLFSPAVNTGSNPDNFTTDQRGEDREQQVGPDIGAFESDFSIVNITIPEETSPPIINISLNQLFQNLIGMSQKTPTVPENTEDLTLDISNLFTDSDNDPITLTLLSNSNPELVTASLDNNQLSLSFAENQFGLTEITIEGNSNGLTVQDTLTLAVTIDPSTRIPLITLPTIEPNLNPSEIINIQLDSRTAIGSDGNDNIFGSGGNDVMFGQKGSDYINGENSADTVYGGRGNDQIQGGNGQDSILGNLGNDIIFADPANDWINGNQNDDFLIAGYGFDTVFGGKNNDTLLGEGGNDELYGNRGVDQIEGNQGDDSLFGGEDNDILSGNVGNDLINGDEGADLLDGNEGEDTLNGGEDNDSLDGGEDNDSLNGGEGDDILLGAEGNNTLTGGEGSDQFIVTQTPGIDTILDFQNGVDLLVLDGGLTFESLTLTQVENNTLIQLNNQTLTVITNITADSLTSDNFVEH